MGMPFVEKHSKSRMYRYQRRVPVELRAVIGRKHIIENLKTKDRKTAERLSAPVHARIEEMFNAARRGEWPPISDESIEVAANLWLRWINPEPVAWEIERSFEDEPSLVDSLREFVKSTQSPIRPGTDAFERLKQEAISEYGQPFVNDFPAQSAGAVAPAVRMRPSEPVGPDNPSITMALALYQAERKLEVRSKPAWETGVRRFVEVRGDLGVKSISREDAVKFQTELRKLPIRGRGTVLEQIARAKETDPRLAIGSVNKDIAVLSAIMNWVIEKHLWGIRNPFAKLTIRDKRHVMRTRYLEFSPEELRTIFEAPLFANASKDPTKRNERFWLPLLALFQGRRLTELGQRLVTDVRKSGSIWYLNVDVENQEQSVKNVGSLGAIPLHPELIRCGFLKYAESLKENNQTRLFPGLATDSATRPVTAPFSQWFTRFRRKLKITHTRKVFHSFRSNWTRAAMNGGITRDKRFALAGREDGDSEAHYRGDGFSLDVLAKEIERVRYDLNLKHIYVDA
jgi:hypothetical protein